MQIKSATDLVKLVNITGKNGEKRDVIFSRNGHSERVKDFLVISRDTAEHGRSKTFSMATGNYDLAIEEMPEGSRTQSDLSRSAEEVNRLLGVVAEKDARIEELETLRLELLEENAKLRGRKKKDD